MEAAIQQANSCTQQQPPLVVTPPGYWVDGTDHRHALDSAGRAMLPTQPAWQPRIDQDDTAKCYRRFFVGRVIIHDYRYNNGVTEGVFKKGLTRIFINYYQGLTFIPGILSSAKKL